MKLWDQFFNQNFFHDIFVFWILCQAVGNQSQALWAAQLKLALVYKLSQLKFIKEKVHRGEKFIILPKWQKTQSAQYITVHMPTKEVRACLVKSLKCAMKTERCKSSEMGDKSRVFYAPPIESYSNWGTLLFIVFFTSELNWWKYMGQGGVIIFSHFQERGLLFHFHVKSALYAKKGKHILK